jgi:hypothetical protein
MPEHIAKVDQMYYDRQIKVGETFEVDDGDVQLLSLLDRIDVDKVPMQNTYATRDMIAQRGKRMNNRKAA